VSDQVSHPFKTTGKILVLYILIFKYLRLECLLLINCTCILNFFWKVSWFFFRLMSYTLNET
jgi:hypothetical protein